MNGRGYSVTYKAKDGRQRTEVMTGRSHTDVVRKIAAIGGTVLNIEREEDAYPRKTRSQRRTVGCVTLVVLLVTLALILYWLILHRGSSLPDVGNIFSRHL